MTDTRCLNLTYYFGFGVTAILNFNMAARGVILNLTYYEYLLLV